MNIEELYKEEIMKRGRTLVEKHLEDVKNLMPKNEYEDMVIELMNIFIAGANCCKEIALEINRIKYEQD